MIAFDTGPKFSLGRIILTPGAAHKLSTEDVESALRRHGRGDWGDVGVAAQQDNDKRVEKGGTLASIYAGSNGVRFYIVTEADRSVTTVLLPHEY